MFRSCACLLLIGGLVLVQVPAAHSQPGGRSAQAEKGGPRTDLYGDPLPPGAIARMGAVRLRHAGRVNSIAFSPDGKVLASGGGGAGVDDPRVRLWDSATGRELRSFVSDTVMISSVAFSPDGKILAAGGDRMWGTGIITLWNLAKGERFGKFMIEGKMVQCLAFSPDGGVLASGWRDGQVRLWEVASGKQLHALSGHEWEITCVRFSPDGKILASSSMAKDRTIRLWEAATGKPLATLKSDDERFFGASGLTFSPDGKFLASAGAPSSPSIGKRSHDNKVRLWDVATGRELRAFEGGEEYPDSVAFSSDGKTLAVPAGKTVRFWDVTAGKELRRLETEAGPVGRVALSPDGRLLAAAAGRSIRLWDVATGKEQFTPAREHLEEVRDIALTPDGKLLASADFKGTVLLWEATTGKPLQRVEDRFVFCVALSPDGKVLASGGYRGICLWDVKTGKESRRLAGKERGACRRLAFSPDGKSLASYHQMDISGQDEVRLWDVATGQQVRALKAVGQAALNQTLAFCQGGKTLAAADGGLKIQLWEVADGKELRRLDNFWKGGGGAHAIAFCPEGKHCAVSANGGVRLFELATGREVLRFPTSKDVDSGHESIISLAFSPDGKTLAAGAFETGRIHLWDALTGKERGRLTGHQASVKSLAFSADGKTLASGSHDGTALMWDVTEALSKARP